MKERPFLDESNKPTEQVMKAMLGSTYAYYSNIIDLVGIYSREWTFSKGSGWMLKIYDRRKALFYLIPYYDGFKISLAIRGNEREAFLDDSKLGLIHDKILLSKKFTEGFALQFEIENMSEFQTVELFIRKLIAMRA